MNYYNNCNGTTLIKRIHFSTLSPSKIIQDAHQSCFKDIEKSIKEDSFSAYANELKNCILSKQEAASALKICLDLNFFEPNLFRDLIKLLEDEYFKPVLLEDSNDKHELYNITKSNPSNTFNFINSLSVKDKSMIIIWTCKVNSNVKKFKRNFTVKRSEKIDPEKKELYITKRTGMVLDPIPIRAKMSFIPPGKKLSNMLSMQLRDHVPNADLMELCYISHIFSTPLPLSGQLNEDTIELIAENFCKFDYLELSKSMFSLSSFCRYAKNRFLEVSSFMDPNINRRPTRGKVLEKIDYRKLSNKFVRKMLESVENYINSTDLEDDYIGYLMVNSDITVHLHILNNLANSDIPISINVWENLVIKLEKLMDYVKNFDVKEIGLYCDSVLSVKYTTENTIEVSRKMFKNFTVACEYNKEDYYLISQILKYILKNRLIGDSSDLLSDSSELIRCICTLTLNNMERIEPSVRVPLVKYLYTFSSLLNDNEKEELM
ncbi:uncharacterized protein TA06405 [Theileria annulata]|uniref:Uncharacterized protein n=1 Tax=Theileria annulata TaxID=5874 RepID=Q4UIB3_THEAN|nr:uncharacterized protein TA06405 [Theileria annulata]CAI73176.1 hypothetical protein TA06405 [Theileria annulata]|eukprot:XP_953854.1 hypothetical protein TA06405 [Theileria annulata]